MKTKRFNEEKDLPNVPFLIMVVMENGEEKPFYVARVGRGDITNATMMHGEYLEKIIEKPTRISYLNPKHTGNERLYIQNQDSKGKHEGVDHYREMTQEETKIWKEKLQPLLGEEIFQQHVESHKEAKQLISSLNSMFI
jgi:hypothetical protein